jgi:hypothetical protein
MSDTEKIAKVLKGFAEGVAAHDRANPTHNTWGIGMAHFDIERLGLEDGEEILPGIVLQADGGQTSQFRILCDGEHDEEEAEEEDIFFEAIAEHEVDVPVYSPGPRPIPPTP